MNSNKRDIFWKGNIFPDTENWSEEMESLYPNTLYQFMHYPVSGPHSWKDGEDVTGRYKLQHQVVVNFNKQDEWSNCSKSNYGFYSKHLRRIVAVALPSPTAETKSVTNLSDKGNIMGQGVDEYLRENGVDPDEVSRKGNEIAKKLLSEQGGNWTDNISCALCGYFCNNYHHQNNWFDTGTPAPSPSQEAEVRAKALVEKFMGGFTIDGRNYITGLDEFEAKGVALICLSEIEQALTEYGRATDELQNMDRTFSYYEKLRTAINQL